MWLDATTKSLEVILSAAITSTQLPWTAAFGEVAADNTTSAAKGSDGQTNGATAVTLVAAPAAGKVRELLHLSVFNADTAAATLTVRLNNAGTFRIIRQVTLQPGDTLTYDSAGGWATWDASGAPKGTGGGGGGAASLPVGMEYVYPSATPPAGSLLLDGVSLVRAAHPGLFTLYGTAFGSADGTHFNLPDMRGRFARGGGAGSGLTAVSLADNGGEETHTLTTAEIPSHTHAVIDPGHGHYDDCVAADSGGAPVTLKGSDNVNDSSVFASQNTTTGITLANTGGGGAHNTLPPWRCIGWWMVVDG